MHIKFIKNEYTEVLSKTTLNESKIIEYDLIVPYGVTHTVLASGLGKIVELYNDIDIITADMITVLDTSFIDYLNMIDNNDDTYATRSAALGSGSVDLFTVDLGEQKETMIFFKVATYNYGSVTLTISGSNDNTNWTEVWSWTRADGGAYPSWANKIDSVYSNYRYIKFTLTNNTGSGGVNVKIYTLKIYDYNISDNIQILDINNSTAEFNVKRHNENISIAIITNDSLSYRILELDYVNSNIITIEST